MKIKPVTLEDGIAGQIIEEKVEILRKKINEIIEEVNKEKQK